MKNRFNFIKRDKDFQFKYSSKLFLLTLVYPRLRTLLEIRLLCKRKKNF